MALFHMERIKVILRAGQRRITKAGTHSERPPPLQEELARAVGGLEMAGRLLGSSPTRQLAQMAAEVGLAPTASGESGHVRPTTGGKTPTEFHRMGLRGPRGTGWGWWLSVRYVSTRKAPNCSSISSLLCT